MVLHAGSETAGIGVTSRKIAMFAGVLIVGGAALFFVRNEKRLNKPSTHAAPHTEHTAAAARHAPTPATPHGSAPSVPVKVSTATAAADQPPTLPTKEDWAEMAKTGETRFCLPVETNWAHLDDIPTAAAHADELAEAYARSRQRLKDALSPMCPDLAGGDALTTVSPLMKCGKEVLHNSGPANAKAARTETDELRAGLKPMPTETAQMKPEARVMLALTGEAQALVDDLSQKLGREEAEKIVFRQHGCAWQHGYGK